MEGKCCRNSEIDDHFWPFCPRSIRPERQRSIIVSFISRDKSLVVWGQLAPGAVCLISAERLTEVTSSIVPSNDMPLQYHNPLCCAPLLERRLFTDKEAFAHGWFGTDIVSGPYNVNAVDRL